MFDSDLVEVITILTHGVASLITHIAAQCLEHIVQGHQQITIMQTGLAVMQTTPDHQEPHIMKVLIGKIPIWC